MNVFFFPSFSNKQQNNMLIDT